jgi:hypothetical protein
MTSEGLSVQDVLPPSIHPDTGKPYEWRGDYNNLVELPELIKTWWLELIGADSQDLPLKIPTLLIHNAFKSIPRALNISTHLAKSSKSTEQVPLYLWANPIWLVKKPYEWRGDYNNLVELPELIKTWWLELIGADSQDIEKSKVDTSWAEIDKILSVIPADIGREQWVH